MIKRIDSAGVFAVVKEDEEVVEKGEEVEGF